MNPHDDYIGYRIQIYPNNEQVQKITQYFGIARYVYNWAIDAVKDNYHATGKFISKFDLNNKFTQYKKNIPWLAQADSTILKGSLFDAHQAHVMFFNTDRNFPRYKSRKTTNQSIYIRSDRLVVTTGLITIPGIGKVVCGRLPNDSIIGAGDKSFTRHQYRHYYDTRLSFDGVNYWLSFVIKKEDGFDIASVNKQIKPEEVSQPIGIDLGAKKNNWIVDSNGVRVRQPDTSKEEKKLKRLHKKLDRQRKAAGGSKTKGRLSNNAKKTLKEINKYHKRITNKRKAIIHDYVSHEIIAKNPEYVVIEDIKEQDWEASVSSNLSGQPRRDCITAIRNSMVCTTQSIIQYKCYHNNIPCIKADPDYPSTQRCSNCGCIQKMGERRVYRCPVCGMEMDRDLNAAKNLKRVPYTSEPDYHPFMRVPRRPFIRF